MRAKISFLLGGAVGYVLGSRAGRQRYEQIKTRSREMWNSPQVQQKVSEAGETVKAKAPVVQHKVGDAAKHATHAAKSKLGGASTDTSEPEIAAAGWNPTPNASAKID